MKICEDFKFYIKEAITDIIITTIIIFSLYVFHELKCNSFIVSLLDCTQNNISVDIKIVLGSIYLTQFAKMWIEEKRDKNMWFNMLVINLFCLAMYITILSIIKYAALVTKIWIILSILIISKILEYILLKVAKFEINNKIEEKFEYLNIFLVIILIIYNVIG